MLDGNMGENMQTSESAVQAVFFVYTYERMRNFLQQLPCRSKKKKIDISENIHPLHLSDKKTHNKC